MEHKIEDVPKITKEEKDKVMDRTANTDTVSFLALIGIPLLYSYLHNDPALAIITLSAGFFWTMTNFYRLRAMVGHIKYLRERW